MQHLPCQLCTHVNSQHPTHWVVLSLVVVCKWLFKPKTELFTI